VGIKCRNLTLTVRTLSAKSRKCSLQNAVFSVNDKCTENSKNDLFSLTLPNPGCQGPPESGKAIGTTRKATGKSRKSYRQI